MPMAAIRAAMVVPAEVVRLSPLTVMRSSRGDKVDGSDIAGNDTIRPGQVLPDDPICGRSPAHVKQQGSFCDALSLLLGD
jgi:hypothetical protein